MTTAHIARVLRLRPSELNALRAVLDEPWWEWVSEALGRFWIPLILFIVAVDPAGSHIDMFLGWLVLWMVVSDSRQLFAVKSVPALRAAGATTGTVILLTRRYCLVRSALVIPTIGLALWASSSSSGPHNLPWWCLWLAVSAGVLASDAMFVTYMSLPSVRPQHALLCAIGIGAVILSLAAVHSHFGAKMACAVGVAVAVTVWFGALLAQRIPHLLDGRSWFDSLRQSKPTVPVHTGHGKMQVGLQPRRAHIIGIQPFWMYFATILCVLGGIVAVHMNYFVGAYVLYAAGLVAGLGTSLLVRPLLAAGFRRRDWLYVLTIRAVILVAITALTLTIAAGFVVSGPMLLILCIGQIAVIGTCGTWTYANLNMPPSLSMAVGPIVVLLTGAVLMGSSVFVFHRDTWELFPLFITPVFLGIAPLVLLWHTADFTPRKQAS